MSHSERMRWLVSGILITTLNFSAVASTNSLAQARQLVVASAPSWNSETGKLEMLSNTSGAWIRHGNEVPVVFGHGLGWGRGLHSSSKSGPQKREGDRRAPA